MGSAVAAIPVDEALNIDGDWRAAGFGDRAGQIHLSDGIVIVIRGRGPRVGSGHPVTIDLDVDISARGSYRIDVPCAVAESFAIGVSVSPVDCVVLRTTISSLIEVVVERNPVNLDEG